MSVATLQQSMMIPTDASVLQWPDFDTPTQPQTAIGQFLFRGQLETPGIHCEIPEQDFTISITQEGVVFENAPQDAWPKFRIEAALDKLQKTLKTKNVYILPSKKSVEAEVLYTRVAFCIAKARRCILRSTNIGTVADLKFHTLPLEQLNFSRHAKLVRKLKYIQDFFKVEFDLPDQATESDVFGIEAIFRGITEGEFVMRMESFQSNIPPTDIDLTKPPFSGPGEFSDYIQLPDLLGQSLPVGSVKVRLNMAEVANPQILGQTRTGTNEPVKVRFVVLDHQIQFRFEEFAKQSREHLRQRLEKFKQELAREEPQELVDLVSEPLQANSRRPRAPDGSTWAEWLSQSADIWRDEKGQLIDAQDYINQERESWD